MQQLLIIDPQNDFMNIEGAALPVSGATADMSRLALFAASTELDGITVTLDSHPAVAVERTTFWKLTDGTAPAPFTFVTVADVVAGHLLPVDETQTPQVLTMLAQLAAAGRPGMVIWPVHCVTGTWGHSIFGDLAKELAQWEASRQRIVRKVLKGEYPLTEHFGVFEADAPDASVPSTTFNHALAQSLTEGVDVLFIAGEASSHCVAASFDQLAQHLQRNGGPRPRIVILRDCTSPVTGFEGAQEAFFERALAFGAELMTSFDATAAFGKGTSNV